MHIFNALLVFNKHCGFYIDRVKHYIQDSDTEDRHIPDSTYSPAVSGGHAFQAANSMFNDPHVNKCLHVCVCVRVHTHARCIYLVAQNNKL